MTLARPERQARHWRLLALAVLLALLTACSARVFFYNRAHFLVNWYVGDYVDLTREQKQQLDQWLNPFLEWHRRTELPRYLALLDRGEQMLEGGLTLEELRQATAEVERAANRVQTRSLDWMLPLGATLTDEQVDEFLANFQEKHEEWEEKYLERDLEEYREDAYDRLLDNCQDYLGRLSRDQRETLREGVARLRRSDRLWLAEHDRWADQLRTLLQREPGWQQRVREALAERWEMASEGYKQAYEHNLSVIQATLLAVINSRSERQDRRLRKEMGKLRKDLLALSQQGLDTAALPPAPVSVQQ